jgi:hypothetical protein
MFMCWYCRIEIAHPRAVHGRVAASAMAAASHHIVKRNLYIAYFVHLRARFHGFVHGNFGGKDKNAVRQTCFRLTLG